MQLSTRKLATKEEYFDSRLEYNLKATEKVSVREVQVPEAAEPTFVRSTRNFVGHGANARYSPDKLILQKLNFDPCLYLL